METREQLLALVGTTGHEDLIYSGYNNTFYKVWEFVDLLNRLTSERTKKKVEKMAIYALETWTWVRVNSSRSPYGFYLAKDDIVIINKANGERMK